MHTERENLTPNSIFQAVSINCLFFFIFFKKIIVHFIAICDIIKKNTVILLLQKNQSGVQMNYKLNLGSWDSIFAVPTDVVDKYIKIAGGSSLKVLLYFLRHSGEQVTDEIISNALSISCEDVSDALAFWKEVGLLDDTGGSFAPASASVRSPQQSVATVQTSVSAANITKEQAEFAAVKAAALRTPEFTPAEIAGTVKSDDKVDFLFKTCETLYGRPLKHTEQNALITITEHIGLPTEVTLMLVHYCFSINKASPAFLKESAMNWMENGITDLASAEKHISMLQSRYSAENTVKSIFGINRALSQKEKDFIDLWFNVWGFSSDMIKLAYDINVNSKGKFAFPYINKILENWHTKGITTEQQVVEERNSRTSSVEVNSSFDAEKLDDLLFDEYT